MRLYPSELKIQIEAVNERLKEIKNEAYEGPLSNPYTKDTKAEYWQLRRRRKELQKRIIAYEPPNDSPARQAPGRTTDPGH